MLPGRQPPGGYTDDTQLMIALAESLGVGGEIDQDGLARRFLEIYDTFRGYGMVFKNFVQLMELGEDWRSAARKIHNLLTGSWNGSAMRVAPGGAFYYRDRPSLARAARLSSACRSPSESNTPPASFRPSSSATASGR